MTRAHYSTLTTGAAPFMCQFCALTTYKVQVQQLQVEIEGLKSELVSAKSATLLVHPREYQPQLPVNQEDEVSMTVPLSIAAARRGGKAFQSSQSANHIVPIFSGIGKVSSKKYNVVLYGVDEYPPGSARSARVELDLATVVSVLSTLDSGLHSQSTKDCYRLGKFDPMRGKPRPIMVEFIRMADVSNVLSKKGKLSRPYYIKPDMTQEQRRLCVSFDEGKMGVNPIWCFTKPNKNPKFKHLRKKQAAWSGR